MEPGEAKKDGPGRGGKGPAFPVLIQGHGIVGPMVAVAHSELSGMSVRDVFLILMAAANRQANGAASPEKVAACAKADTDALMDARIGNP